MIQFPQNEQKRTFKIIIKESSPIVKRSGTDLNIYVEDVNIFKSIFIFGISILLTDVVYEGIIRSR